MADNFATLNHFFSFPIESLIDVPKAYIAMRDLVADAADDKAIRVQFASQFIWEKALSPDTAAKERQGGSDGAVRQAMVDGIYRSVTGGWWGGAEPGGLTEWIGSEDTARVAVTNTLLAETDTAPNVVAGLLRLLRDAAIPVPWLGPLQAQNVFKRLDVRTRESPWTMADRRVISALTAQAAGRVTGELAKAAMSNLPLFQTGDGAKVPTTPPASKKWYRNGWVWAGAGMALASGGVLAAKR